MRHKAWFPLLINTKNVVDFWGWYLFHAISRCKRPQLMLFQVHCELTSSYFMKKRKLNIKTLWYLIHVTWWNKKVSKKTDKLTNVESFFVTFLQLSDARNKYRHNLHLHLHLQQDHILCPATGAVEVGGWGHRVQHSLLVF